CIVNGFEGRSHHKTASDSSFIAAVELYFDVQLDAFYETSSLDDGHHQGSRIGRQPNSVKHRCAIEIEKLRSIGPLPGPTVTSASYTSTSNGRLFHAPASGVSKACPSTAAVASTPSPADSSFFASGSPLAGSPLLRASSTGPSCKFPVSPPPTMGLPRPLVGNLDRLQVTPTTVVMITASESALSNMTTTASASVNQASRLDASPDHREPDDAEACVPVRRNAASQVAMTPETATTRVALDDSTPCQASGAIRSVDMEIDPEHERAKMKPVKYSFDQQEDGDERAVAAKLVRRTPPSSGPSWTVEEGRLLAETGCTGDGEPEDGTTKGSVVQSVLLDAVAISLGVDLPDSAIATPTRSRRSGSGKPWLAPRMGGLVAAPSPLVAGAETRPAEEEEEDEDNDDDDDDDDDDNDDDEEEGEEKEEEEEDEEDETEEEDDEETRREGEMEVSLETDGEMEVEVEMEMEPEKGDHVKAADGKEVGQTTQLLLHSLPEQRYSPLLHSFAAQPSPQRQKRKATQPNYSQSNRLGLGGVTGTATTGAISKAIIVSVVSGVNGRHDAKGRVCCDLDKSAVCAELVKVTERIGVSEACECSRIAVDAGGYERTVCRGVDVGAGGTADGIIGGPSSADVVDSAADADVDANVDVDVAGYDRLAGAVYHPLGRL
ncbi:unnamed protein product, partial [Protopolystoma xenopodis]